MLTKANRLCLILILCLCVFVIPAMAGAYTTIPQGSTVFIGEQGLDVSAAVGSDPAIGWWASGAAIATSSPDDQIQVPTPSNFYISSSAFGPYTGTWYRLTSQGKPDGVAFIVADPSLDIRVVDTTINLDVTNKWVPRGDQVAFRIDTNLNQIFSRSTSGSPSEGITIYVQSPAGGTYSALLDSSGTPHALENIPVTVSTYQTPWSWDTGNSQYSAGTYSIWAKCDVNSMYDNYGVTGKTISQQTSLLDQEQNPLISVNVPTTNPTSQAITTSTTIQPVIPTTVITTIPPSLQTTPHGTQNSSVAATTLPVPNGSVSLAPLETIPTQSGGFGTLLTLVSVCAIAAVILIKRH